MIGVRTPDKVVFVADALFSGEILDKYRLVYLYDIAAYFNTLDELAALKADLYIPSHASPTESLDTLIEENRRNTWWNLCATVLLFVKRSMIEISK